MDLFGIKRRREAREKAEREAKELRAREQEDAIFNAGRNKPSELYAERRQYLASRLAYDTRRHSEPSPYSPTTDIMSPLNPASPISIYSPPSCDSGPSCSPSSDSGSSSSDSGPSSGGGCD